MRLPAHFLLLPMAVATVQVAYAQDTAYQALRTLGSSRDQALLNRIVEVKGRNGSPQPDTWLIVIDDPKARGGVREVEISGGHISSERTPVQAYSGSSADSVMDMSRLNLDSQGAFTVAEDEARAAGVAFDSVDYVLRRDENGTGPTWILQLLDRSERGVGTVRISATDGKVASRQFRAGGERIASDRPSGRSNARSAPPASEPDDNGEAAPPPPPQKSRSSRTSTTRSSQSGAPPRSATGRQTVPSSRSSTYEEPRSSGRGQAHYRTEPREAPEGRTNVYDRDPSKRSDVGYRVNRRVHRMGGAIQKFFTGKRTVDEEYREPYD